jgi:hypothetical protein
MATAIVPKSEARYCNAILHGFAELPSVDMEDGRTCWALPGNIIVCDENEAKREAKKLDVMIRENVKKTGRVLH